MSIRPWLLPSVVLTIPLVLYAQEDPRPPKRNAREVFGARGDLTRKAEITSDIRVRLWSFEGVFLVYEADPPGEESVVIPAYAAYWFDAPSGEL